MVSLWFPITKSASFPPSVPPALLLMHRSAGQRGFQQPSEADDGVGAHPGAEVFLREWIGERENYQ